MGVYFLATSGIDAAEIVVTTSEDQLDTPAGSELSLREAIRDSVEAGRITFDPALSGATLVLAMGTLELERRMTIDGSALAESFIIDGDSRVSILDVGGVYPVVIDSITFQRGLAETEPIFVDGSLTGVVTVSGSAISSASRILQIDNCLFSSNDGAALLSGGGTTITDSVFEDNSAEQGGGAILNNGDTTVRGTKFLRNGTESGEFNNGGGAIANPWDRTSLRIEECYFEGNTSGWNGGALYVAGGFVSVSGSTFTENRAETFGGAVCAVGGMLTLRSSTFTGNEMGSNGFEPEGSAVASIAPEGDVTIRRCTMIGNSSNSSDHAGPDAIYTDGSSIEIEHSTIIDSIQGHADYSNSILASSWEGVVPGADQGNFMIFGATQPGEFGLLPLGDYGGPTMTMPPHLFASVLIDQAVPGSIGILDQRGLPAVVDGDGDGTARADIGAVERQSHPDQDPDGDGISTRIERLLKSDADVAAIRPDTDFTLDSDGATGLSFEVSEEEFLFSRLVVRRSTDLKDWEEVFSMEGFFDIQMDESLRLEGDAINPNRVKLIDDVPDSPRYFYRFEALPALP